jgi:hypothetical protein
MFNFLKQINAKPSTNQPIRPDQSAPVFLAVLMAFPTQLSVLIGKPNLESPEVKALVTESADLVRGAGESYFSTEVYSLLASRGVRSTSLFSVVNSKGSSDFSVSAQALHDASSRAPIVLVTVIGSKTGDLCSEMAKNPNTVFVVPAGSSAQILRAEYTPDCAAPNILFVGAMNKDQTDLAPYSNRGTEIVRVAASGMIIKKEIPGHQGARRLGTTFAATRVAADLVKLAEARKIQGVHLVKAFLRRATTIPALKGKVKDSKALQVDFFQE